MDAVAVAPGRGRPGPVFVERVTTIAALEALRPEWEALWRSVPHRTPFQHPAWLLPWWEAFGVGELRALVVRNAEAVVGLAPLYISPEREIRLLGAGISDYLDALAVPGTEGALAAAIAGELESSGGDWTFCAFDNLQEESVLHNVDAPPGVHATDTATDPCPIVRLPNSLDALFEGITPKLASHIRYSRRRARRLGELSVEQVSGTRIQEALASLYSLHGAQWAAKGQAGVLSDDTIRRFHRNAATALDEAGLLRLMCLRVGSRVAAIHYGMHAADRSFFYLGGFDRQMGTLSVGSLAIAAAMERAIAERASTFDFLGGREAYKYRWGAVDRRRRSRHFTRHDPGGA